MALVFALAGGVSAQQAAPADASQQQPGTATLHVTSRLVVLDVVVVDKSGHPVSNLDRSQFSVTENKAPQTIRNFDGPAGHAMPVGSESKPVVNGTADLAKIGNAPVNILVFDELNTKWEDTAYARNRMEKFLRAQPEILPVPTLLLASGDSRFMVLHDYTQSRADLLAAVKTHFPQYPWQMMKGKSGNNGIDLMSQTLGALSQIAESTRGTPGRKNVIWVGAGYPSIDTTNLYGDDEEKLMNAIRTVTDRMLSARITLYMVDPAGVQTTHPDTGAAGADDSSMTAEIANVGPYTGELEFSTFARATGGEVFYNRNDLDVAIKEGVQEGGVYYTLSYSPTTSSDAAAAYRRIRVKVNDPSLRVITRDGYFAEATPVDKVPAKGEKPGTLFKFDLLSAARTRLAYNGLRVEAKQSKDGYRLLLGAKELHWESQPDGSRMLEVTVMTVFFDAKDKELSSHAMELKEKIGADVPLTANLFVPLELPVAIPEKTARVRFVVRDAATGVLGTADSR